MAPAMPSVADTKTGAKVLGKIWTNKIRNLLAPDNFAAPEPAGRLIEVALYEQHDPPAEP